MIRRRGRGVGPRRRRLRQRRRRLDGRRPAAFAPVALSFQLLRLVIDLVGGGVEGQLDALTGRFAMEKPLAPRVQRDLRPNPRRVAGQHDVGGDGAVVQQPERVIEPLFDEGSHGRGDGEMSSCEFETHSDRNPTQGRGPEVSGTEPCVGWMWGS